MRLIISISGKAGHGKTTLAEHIDQETSGVKVFHLNFADALKDFAISLFDLHEEDVFSQEGKLRPLDKFGGITPRDILQVLGTNIVRDLYSEMWVYKYEMGIEDIDDYCLAADIKNYIIVTSDVRFKNEYHFYDSIENTLRVRVIRPEFEIDQSNHSSETDLDDIKSWDYKIIASTVDGLKSSSGSMIKEIHDRMGLRASK